MNDIWHFLREFESKELVKRFITKKLSYTPNSEKAFEITSAFFQGREYFSSASSAHISVKPLLQYYGIVALSRGLILLLNRSSRENNIVPSHGLKIKNWGDVSASGKLEEVILKTSKGTFTELLNITKNKSYFRAGSSAINWKVSYDIPVADIEFSLGEVAMGFPDLHQSLKVWLNQEIPSRQLNKLTHVDGKLELEVQGKCEASLLKKIFSDSYYGDLEFITAEDSSLIRFKDDKVPHMSQKWISSFQVIGDPYVIPPFGNGLFLNDISKLYSASFILGTISRYYPSTWSNLNRGIVNDSALPFIINLLDFLQDKYPRVIMDFINAPYSFEADPNT